MTSGNHMQITGVRSMPYKFRYDAPFPVSLNLAYFNLFFLIAKSSSLHNIWITTVLVGAQQPAPKKKILRCTRRAQATASQVYDHVEENANKKKRHKQKVDRQNL